MKIQIKNSIWFITGASKGIGLHLAKRLLSAGAKVAVTSRSKASASIEFEFEFLFLSSLGIEIPVRVSGFGVSSFDFYRQGAKDRQVRGA
jgi:NAD(P)-dependent dehydrogenase (short-subunit alcohol dehydrogenase family)